MKIDEIVSNPVISEDNVEVNAAINDIHRSLLNSNAHPGPVLQCALTRARYLAGSARGKVEAAPAIWNTALMTCQQQYDAEQRERQKSADAALNDRGKKKSGGASKSLSKLDKIANTFQYLDKIPGLSTAQKFIKQGDISKIITEKDK
jgi:hypothetical protein